VAVDASIPDPARDARSDAQPAHPGLEDLYAPFWAHARKMAEWAASDEAHRLGHADLEAARLLAQAHLDQRARAERRRHDVRDVDGDLRTSLERGHTRRRIMIFGGVVTDRFAYRADGKGNLYPQDADLAWGTRAYSAGIERRVAEAAAVMPFEQVAKAVSDAGAIRLGKHQAEQLALQAAVDFDAFYTTRRPDPSPDTTGLLISCDGSALPVRPDALRPATAKTHAARARDNAEHGWPEDPTDLRRSRTRGAEIAAVADVPPGERTADEVLGALFGPRTGPKPANPQPRTTGRTVFASVTRPAADVIGDAFAEATAAIRPASARGSRWSTGTTTRSRPSRRSPRPATRRSRS
jgi:hypothetical protein